MRPSSAASVLSLLLLPPLALASELEAGTVARTFYALRHGQSLANVQGLISSSPELALTEKHGLSAAGREQAESAAEQVVALARETGCGVAICSSDFSRAWQTACRVYNAVEQAGIPIWPAGGQPDRETLLRERWFGDLDGGPDTEYPTIWMHDAQDSAHTHFGVESVDAVRSRVHSVVERLKVEVDMASPAVHQWMVILVAHGDVLQIGQTLFAGIAGTRHRELPHLPTATLRELGIGEFPVV